MLWFSNFYRIFPEYWTPAPPPPSGQRGQQYPQLALDLVPELWLRGGLTGGQDFYNTHTVPSLNFAWLSRGVPLLGAPRTDRLSPTTLWGLVKRIFPEYWPAGSGTHRTLLQYPHSPVPEFFLALPWCTAARGTRHRSPVPIYPLGLEKTNFPRILNPRGAKGATIPTTCTRSDTWTLIWGGLSGSQDYV